MPGRARAHTHTRVRVRVCVCVRACVLRGQWVQTLPGLEAEPGRHVIITSPVLNVAELDLTLAG